VVDCDNEQNATLLFKSARNSTSNQASLAVAVVEGQAGVAKAFRIGANLVLTKPINIEQAKGTLRVARGLLRKGEPAKPGAPGAAIAPPKASAAKPVPPASPAIPAAPVAAATPRPVAPPETKPAPAWPATAAASSAIAAHVPAAHKPPANDDDLLEVDEPIAAPSAAAPVFNKFGVPASQAVTLPDATRASTEEVKTKFSAASPSTHTGGAASAPAPAREVHDSHVAEMSRAHTAAEAQPPSDSPAEAALHESSSYAGSSPSFTFGGANVPAESSGGSKKILVGVAAAAVVAAGLYVGWTKFQGRESHPVSTQTSTTPAPIAVPQTAKPSSAKPAPTIPALKPETSESAKTRAVGEPDFASDDASAPSSTKPSNSTSPSPNNSAAASKSPAAPLVVKGGKAPALHSKSAAADAPAPSMIGIATTGAGAPPPDIVSAEGAAPKPILQTLNVSQGVSQGLLMKKVQPTYPKNALVMRVEGAVELLATISKTGDISHIKILSGDSQLTRAAAEAVKQWKYKPYLLNGEPVEIQTQITINFKLPK
jgi:protein TonB